MWAAAIWVDSAWVGIALTVLLGVTAWSFRIERLVTRMEQAQESLVTTLQNAVESLKERLDRHSDVNDSHAERIRKCEESMIALTEATKIIAGIRRMDSVNGDSNGTDSGVRKRKVDG